MVSKLHVILNSVCFQFVANHYKYMVQNITAHKWVTFTTCKCQSWVKLLQLTYTAGRRSPRHFSAVFSRNCRLTENALQAKMHYKLGWKNQLVHSTWPGQVKFVEVSMLFACFDYGWRSKTFTIFFPVLTNVVVMFRNTFLFKTAVMILPTLFKIILSVTDWSCLSVVL